MEVNEREGKLTFYLFIAHQRALCYTPFQMNSDYETNKHLNKKKQKCTAKITEILDLLRGKKNMEEIIPDVESEISSRELTEEELKKLLHPESASITFEEYCDMIKKRMVECPQNDIFSQTSICNSINHYHFEFEEIQRQVVLSICAESGNLPAMLLLAGSYKNRDFPQESDPEYLYWLEKLINDKRTKDYINSLTSHMPLKDYDTNSIGFLGLCASMASYELGLYYKSAENLDDLRKALKYFEIAHACGYMSYPNPPQAERIIEELSCRINRLEIYEQNQKAESQQIKLIRDISIDNLDINTQISTLKTRLINELGIDIWNRFQPQTRSCLLTAVSCFFYLQHATEELRDELDYSSVIIPLMKCLEHELQIRFYNNYIDYLKASYPSADDFLNTNQLNGKKDATIKRGKILYWKKREHKYDYSNYNLPGNKFTLGSFAYIVGFLDSESDSQKNLQHSGVSLTNPAPVDQTMLNYCKSVLFQESSNDEDIKNWLLNLAIQLEALSNKRNISAHGGSVQSSFSAIEAIEDLFYPLQKTLIDLLEKCH